MNDKQLIKEAFKAREKSYSPYSHFKVGAVILCKDNKIYYGANIENASYSLTICAERVALFNAYMDGKKKKDIIKVVIVTDAETISTSCGACRQVLNELLDKDTPIIFANKKDTLTLTVKELLPNSFDPENLK